MEEATESIVNTLGESTALSTSQLARATKDLRKMSPAVTTASANKTTRWKAVMMRIDITTRAANQAEIAWTIDRDEAYERLSSLTGDEWTKRVVRLSKVKEMFDAKQSELRPRSKRAKWRAMLKRLSASDDEDLTLAQQTAKEPRHREMVAQEITSRATDVKCNMKYAAHLDLAAQRKIAAELRLHQQEQKSVSSDSWLTLEKLRVFGEKLVHSYEEQIHNHDLGQQWEDACQQRDSSKAKDGNGAARHLATTALAMQKLVDLPGCEVRVKDLIGSKDKVDAGESARTCLCCMVAESDDFAEGDDIDHTVDEMIQLFGWQNIAEDDQSLWLVGTGSVLAAAIWRVRTELSDLAALDKCRIDLVRQLVGITMIQDLEIPVNPKHHSDRLRVWHSFLRQSDSATNVSSELVEDLRQMDPAQADENRARHRQILVEATQSPLDFKQQVEKEYRSVTGQQQPEIATPVKTRGNATQRGGRGRGGLGRGGGGRAQYELASDPGVSSAGAVSMDTSPTKSVGAMENGQMKIDLVSPSADAGNAPDGAISPGSEDPATTPVLAVSTAAIEHPQINAVHKLLLESGCFPGEQPFSVTERLQDMPRESVGHLYSDVMGDCAQSQREAEDKHNRHLTSSENQSSDKGVGRCMPMGGLKIVYGNEKTRPLYMDQRPINQRLTNVITPKAAKSQDVAYEIFVGSKGGAVLVIRPVIRIKKKDTEQVDLRGHARHKWLQDHEVARIDGRWDVFRIDPEGDITPHKDASGSSKAHSTSEAKKAIKKVFGESSLGKVTSDFEAWTVRWESVLELEECAERHESACDHVVQKSEGSGALAKVDIEGGTAFKVEGTHCRNGTTKAEGRSWAISTTHHLVMSDVLSLVNQHDEDTAPNVIALLESEDDIDSQTLWYVTVRKLRAGEELLIAFGSGPEGGHGMPMNDPKQQRTERASEVQKRSRPAPNSPDSPAERMAKKRVHEAPASTQSERHRDLAKSIREGCYNTFMSVNKKAQKAAVGLTPDLSQWSKKVDLFEMAMMAVWLELDEDGSQSHCHDRIDQLAAGSTPPSISREEQQTFFVERRDAVLAEVVRRLFKGKEMGEGDTVTNRVTKLIEKAFDCTTTAMSKGLFEISENTSAQELTALLVIGALTGNQDSSDLLTAATLEQEEMEAPQNTKVNMQKLKKLQTTQHERLVDAVFEARGDEPQNGKKARKGSAVPLADWVTTTQGIDFRTTLLRWLEDTMTMRFGASAGRFYVEKARVASYKTLARSAQRGENITEAMRDSTSPHDAAGKTAADKTQTRAARFVQMAGPVIEQIGAELTAVTDSKAYTPWALDAMQTIGVSWTQ